MCLYLLLNLFKIDLFFIDSGSHLLSHTVSSAVPSAAWVLTIVFGMGTGVSPKRIATRKLWVLITQQQNNLYLFFLRKEVIQPHLPIRLPCYDFTPVISPAFGSSLRKRLGHWLRALPTPMVWRAVCTRPGNVFTATFWFAITSDSSFM